MKLLKGLSRSTRHLFVGSNGGVGGGGGIEDVDGIKSKSTNSIGSDISSREQFDILIPTKLPKTSPPMSSVQSWGASVVGCLDKEGTTLADEASTVSSITSAPDVNGYRPFSTTDCYCGRGENNNDDSPAEPYMSDSNKFVHLPKNSNPHHHSDSNNGGSASSWFCCSTDAQCDSNHHHAHHTHINSSIDITTEELAEGEGTPTILAAADDTVLATAPPAPFMRSQRLLHYNHRGGIPHPESFVDAKKNRKKERHATAAAATTTTPLAPPAIAPTDPNSINCSSPWCCADTNPPSRVGSTTTHPPVDSLYSSNRSMVSSRANRSMALFDALEDEHDDIMQSGRGGGMGNDGKEGVTGMKKLRHNVRRAIPWVMPHSSSQQHSKNYRHLVRANTARTTDAAAE